ncbi:MULTISPECIES: glycosyl-4,4'-diaponeurosporenoate acyltransferase CrtO family protein [Rossellomorea]|jgi:glycosyl-4,4'-diaponeurosporenoate acyltransferase|uniref:glycosyl-4,4'-diaponeurosporenoate acyltransferase CrtO family protein n=1 Tax=Rossellomorea TaxID=2837508 RepID=UPI001CA3D7EA|nr:MULTISPECIES: hypothetical protein [Rossellomorea]MDT9024386.1 hypothetical protein [Rossellomorea sp. YC4-1]
MIILVNIFAWVSIHFVISFLTSRLTNKQLQRLSPLFHPLEMEAGGGIFEFLKIKKWKEYIPDAGRWFRGGVNKNEIGLTSHQGRITFLYELTRAELSHWLQMIPAPFFFILNNGVESWIMFLYGISFNLPLILVQRYNRMRIVKIIAQYSPSKSRPSRNLRPHISNHFTNSE